VKDYVAANMAGYAGEVDDVAGYANVADNVARTDDVADDVDALTWCCCV